MVTRTKKIFVGGLSADTIVDDLKTYFSQYGKVQEFCIDIISLLMRHREICIEYFINNDVFAYQTKFVRASLRILDTLFSKTN